MDLQKRLLWFMNNRGTTATLYFYTGTACPCFGNGTYDPVYHAKNPLVENCNGTGLIDSTLNNEVLKVFPFNANYYSLISPANFPEKSPIGNLDRYAAVIIGSADSDCAFFSLKSYIERTSYLLLDGEKFKIKDVYPIYGLAEIVGLNRYE